MEYYSQVLFTICFQVPPSGVHPLGVLSLGSMLLGPSPGGPSSIVHSLRSTLRAPPFGAHPSESTRVHPPGSTLHGPPYGAHSLGLHPTGSAYWVHYPGSRLRFQSWCKLPDSIVHVPPCRFHPLGLNLLAPTSSLHLALLIFFFRLRSSTAIPISCQNQSALAKSGNPY
jgi:hypothetical protein